MCQINYRQFAKEASQRTAVILRHREDHEPFPLADYFSFQKSDLNSSRFGPYPMDLFNSIFNAMSSYVSLNPPLTELTNFFSQFLNGKKKRYYHKAAPELIANKKSCTLMFRFDEFLVFQGPPAAERFVKTLLSKFQITNGTLANIITRCLLSLKSPASAVLENQNFSSNNAISSFELITLLFDTITLMKNVLKYVKFDKHSEAGLELDIRYVHKELALEARKENSGCLVYHYCKHFKQEWYLEKTKCLCEPPPKGKRPSKQIITSAKRCKVSDATSVLEVQIEEDDSQTFLRHSSLVTTVLSAPGSPQNSPPNTPVPQNSPTVSSNTPASIPNAQTETEGIDDVETIDLIDTDDDKMEAVEEEEEEAEEAEKEDEAEDVEINVDMFRFVTDAVVDALHKACHKDEKISSLLNSFKIALDNERG